MHLEHLDAHVQPLELAAGEPASPGARTAASDRAAHGAGVGERPGPDRARGRAAPRARLKNSTSARSDVGVARPAADDGRPLEVRVGTRTPPSPAGEASQSGVGVVAQHEPDEAGEHDHAERQQPGQQRVVVAG